jgi:nucleoside-diphosphate-sugar epimerase
MKYLITGGAGFIGSHLTEFLVRNKDHVVVVDNLKGGKLENLRSVINKIEFHELDILNFNEMKKLAKDVDGIFHQAGLTSVQESFLKKKEYFDVNVTGTENMLKLAKEFGLKIVFASSASVYGNPQVVPIKENFTRKPLNPYGESKMKAEDLILKYVQTGLSTIMLRYFNVYGPRQNIAYAGVIAKLLDNIKNKTPMMIHGDGLQTRDFVHVEDVARANFLAMKSKVGHVVVNIGSGIPVSINDMANMIIQASDSKINLIHDDAQPGDIRFSHADIELAKDLFDWKPETDLNAWLNSIINN